MISGANDLLIKSLLPIILIDWDCLGSRYNLIPDTQLSTFLLMMTMKSLLIELCCLICPSHRWVQLKGLVESYIGYNHQTF